MFDRVAQIDETACRRFEKDWFAGRRSRLENYLPPKNAENFLSTLEELVHIEIELAWEETSRDSAAHESSIPTRTTAPAIEAYLARFPQLRRDDVLLRLVRQEYAVRRRCGEFPTLNEYQRRFPQLPLAEESFETKLLSHFQERTRIRGDSAQVAETDALDQPLQVFGQYELTEVIGRGGMGVVYRARQRDAQRDVALKVIRLAAIEGLEPERRRSIAERFHTEALAASRLTHDNIVTVYDVGEHEGRPYYAMRLVQGPSLAELSGKNPITNRRAAAYMEGAARAIHAAHQHGVLHRDVKPQNILVDAPTDRPLVADFGLAKLMQDTQSVTRSGELIGTPCYMAPEQIDNAASAGPESDVYSLGATLYHLLTGRPPFQAASLTDTLWQVKHQEPVSPRQLNSAVDRDLDTICLKCLQKEPSRRYSTASALADDLRRYLDGAPILARPIGLVGRAIRWRRRNRMAAAALMAAAVSVLIAAGVGVFGYVSTLAAMAKYRHSFQTARQAVEDLHIAVSENDLLNQPGMQPLRHTLLRRALDYYQLFLQEQAGDRTIARELASAAFQAGKITEELDSPEQAMRYYLQARDAQLALLAANPDDAANWEALGDTRNACGAALRKMQRLDEAAAELTEAARLREALVQRAPHEFEPQRKLANVYMNLGIVASARGDRAAARRYAAQGQAIRDRLSKVAPDDLRLLVDTGKEHYNLAKLALMENRPDEATVALQTAIAAFVRRRETHPEDLNNRGRLAACYRLLGQVCCSSDAKSQLAEGFKAYQIALETMESLAKDNPRVGSYQAELAAIHLELAALFRDQGRIDDTLQALETARSVLEPLITVEPRYRRDFAVALREIACTQLASNQSDLARGHLDEALEHFKTLAEDFPEDLGYQADLTQTVRLTEMFQQHE
jgi:tetratricopeptide (TPR) repeat protein